MKKILLLSVLIILLPLALAQDLIVTKTAPAELNLGEELTITIEITNSGAAEKQLFVKETLTSEEYFDYVDPTEPDGVVDPFTKTPYFSWEITAPAGQTKTINYTIKTKMVGSLEIPPTRVTDEKENTFTSEAIAIKIKCIPDDKCDIDKYENYITCPEDCSPSIKENICNPIKDGTCDPDCLRSADPDCTICNKDGACESDEGEDYQNCPQDCPKPELREKVEEKALPEEIKVPSEVLWVIIGAIIAAIVTLGLMYVVRTKKQTPN